MIALRTFSGDPEKQLAHTCTRTLGISSSKQRGKRHNPARKLGATCPRSVTVGHKSKQFFRPVRQRLQREADESTRRGPRIGKEINVRLHKSGDPQNQGITRIVHTNTGERSGLS